MGGGAVSMGGRAVSAGGGTVFEFKYLNTLFGHIQMITQCIRDVEMNLTSHMFREFIQNGMKIA